MEGVYVKMINVFFGGDGMLHEITVICRKIQKLVAVFLTNPEHETLIGFLPIRDGKLMLYLWRNQDNITG